MIAAPIGFPYVLMHDACGQPAFFLRFMPEKNGKLQSEHAISARGTAIDRGMEVCCTSCGDPITWDELSSDKVLLATDVTEPDTGET